MYAHANVLKTTKILVQPINNFTFSSNNVTTIHNQSCINANAYVMQNSKHVPILLNLQKVIKKGCLTSNNLIKMTIQFLSMHDGFFEHDIPTKMLRVGANKVFCVLKGIRTKVVVQIKEKHVIYIIGVHCIARHTNLVGHNHVWGTPSRLQNKDRL
jgi:hypothetical protein